MRMTNESKWATQRDLLQKVGGGRSDALSELYADWNPRGVRLAKSKGLHHHDAEDVAASATLRLVAAAARKAQITAEYGDPWGYFSRSIDWETAKYWSRQYIGKTKPKDDANGHDQINETEEHINDGGRLVFDADVLTTLLADFSPPAFPDEEDAEDDAARQFLKSSNVWTSMTPRDQLIVLIVADYGEGRKQWRVIAEEVSRQWGSPISRHTCKQVWYDFRRAMRLAYLEHFVQEKRPIRPSDRSA